MKEVANLILDKEEEFIHLKLMVVYRNSEKMLADALGSPDGITLFYYHHSTSYKYQGRLRAQNILSSVYHFMTHPPTEKIPLKALHTQQELDKFFQTTDKAILLLEFCGWSADLLNKANHEDNKTTQSAHSNTETVGPFEENHFRRSGGKASNEKIKNHKIQGLESDDLTCKFESGLADSALQGGSIWTHQTDSHGTNYASDDAEISCTSENYHEFKSFFLEFMKIAREYFWPPERHRFGLISERSLLPFLDVGSPQTWLVVVKFIGCSNCSILVHEGDDLRTILQTHHTLVEEVDADGSLDSVFPANSPSVILFIDRSSDSSKLRGESKLALQVFREFVEDNQFSDQIVLNRRSSHLKHSSRKKIPDAWSQIISDNSFQQGDIVTSQLVNFQDMATVLANKGKFISLDTTADAQGNSLYSTLTNLLNRKKPAAEKKEAKISSLAKEVGFQLLSDDFEVQATDALPSHAEDSQLGYIHDTATTNMEDQTSKLPLESKEDHAVSSTIILDSDDIASVNEEKQPEHTNMGSCLQQNLQNQQNQQIISYGNFDKLTRTLPKELEDDICSISCNGDHKNDKQEVLQSFTCPAKDAEQEWPILEKPIGKQSIEQIDYGSNKASSNLATQSLTDVVYRKNLAGNAGDGLMKSLRTSMLDEWHNQQIPFTGSFFFSDGGYRLLRSLTGGAKIPSLVILDPVFQEHYVYPKEASICYSSLGNFIKEFSNGSLTPYQRSASTTMSSRESPRPPFVNLDFHEAYSIPRVTADTFCELIVGYEPCKLGVDLSLSQIQNFKSIWKMDVLVLFCTSSCGFCQRMELVVREVYRAFKNLMAMLNSDAIQDNAEDSLTNGLPSIFLMDCTLNDCSGLLKPISKREFYPALLLFPAENKTAVNYDGEMSVVSIIEFLISRGRNSHILSTHKGFFLPPSRKGNKKFSAHNDESSFSHESYAQNKQNEIIHRNNAARLDDPSTSNNLHNERYNVVAGSVLAATDMLLHAAPFGNSIILIVAADTIQGFQGIIINMRTRWDIFKQLDPQLEPLKKAPIFYGGPVRTDGFPLVSLARKAMKDYVEVTSGIYYGNPLATRSAIERIRSGDLSAYDFWFFVGYSSWAWNQLFDELAAGAWHLRESTTGILDWPNT